ncbi:serine protease [Streptomyces winkii]|uniref:serine protease n=1 Tax=Streptomyces winkii TaxID=3051178 RepID=UPI0028D8A5DD|nr:serine protease [Streptomyces sp. DSM 40971]
MWNRIASVEYAGRVGAGCVVAPGVILTARHLVEFAAGHENEPRIVQISNHETEGPRARAELAWQRGDIALLRCRPRDLGREFAPIRWGELACTKPPAPGPECAALGLPHEAMLRLFGDPPGAEGEFRQPQGVTGRITSVDNASRIYSLQIDHQPPEHLRGEGSLWRGMAGAALFCGELLIGVVADPPSGWSHGRLEAVPARQLLEDRVFCDIVESACGVRPRLEAADLDGLLDGTPQPVAAASYLLSPRSEVVEFLGLDAEIGALSGWCGTSHAVDVAVLQGEGGSGKTRLGLELVRRLSERRAEAECDPSGPDVPWTAGFLSDATAQHPAPYGMLRHLTRPALIVVDDAETRLAQVEELLRALSEHRTPPGRRIRVLLTARSTRGWWEQLKGYHPDVISGTSLALDPGAVYRQYTPAQVQELAELSFGRRILTLHRSGVPDDWDAYEAADRRAALPARGERKGGDGVPGVLTVHMDALSSVLLQSPGEPTDGHPASVTLLDHELQYVRRGVGGEGLEELGPELLRTLITVQGMAGAQDKEEADAVVTAAWDFHHRGAPCPLDPDTLLRLRRAASDLYPALDGGHFGSVGPAALTAALIDREEEGSGGEFLAFVLPSPGFSPQQRQRCLATIARSISAQPHLVQAAARAIAADAGVLAGPAAGIARQLPEPWQVAWLKSIEKASTGREQRGRAPLPAEVVAAAAPSAVGTAVRSSLPAAPAASVAPAAPADVQQDQEPHVRLEEVHAEPEAEEAHEDVQDEEPADSVEASTAPVSRDVGHEEPRPEPMPGRDLPEAPAVVAPDGRRHAPTRSERFWNHVNAAGAFQLLVMISIPLTLVVSVIWMSRMTG